MHNISRRMKNQRKIIRIVRYVSMNVQYVYTYGVMHVSMFPKEGQKSKVGGFPLKMHMTPFGPEVK